LQLLAWAVVGNKTDKTKEVSTEEGKRFADSIEALFFEVVRERERIESV
jgi:hypothetical protein